MLLIGNGTVPTFGLWYDFRQRLPLGDYARFYAACLEEIEAAERLGFTGLPGVTHEQALTNMRRLASQVAPRIRDAVKV
jgi:hypothetical protein